MDFVKLALSPYKTYHYQSSSDAHMLTLGHFLISDVGCTLDEFPTYQDWAFNDSLGTSICSNCTFLEKEKNLIVLSDLYSEQKPITQLIMTRQQFVQILDDWQEKVCKHRPKEVTITYDGNQFSIKIISH